MADLKISQLTGATTPLAGSEVLPIVQSSTTKKVAVSDLTAGRAVSMDTATTTGKANLGNGPAAVIGRADVAVHAANRASNATTANLFVATSNAVGADIGGSIAMGGYVDATTNIPLATWSGRKVTGTSGNYAGYALLTISDSGGGTVDTWKVLSDGSLRQLVANSGVNFTANTPAAGMTSQLLNWYEQGTFTATLTSATPPTTPITATAYYTRVGDMVTVYCAFRDVNNTGAAGAISVTGLPFTSNANSYAVGQVWNSRATITNGLVANVSPSSTTITLLDFLGNTVSWASTGAGLYAGFQITYKV